MWEEMRVGGRERESEGERLDYIELGLTCLSPARERRRVFSVSTGSLESSARSDISCSIATIYNTQGSSLSH